MTSNLPSPAGPTPHVRLPSKPPQALLDLVAGWAEPALLIGPGGNVVAANPPAGEAGSLALPPDDSDAAGECAGRDGRTWRLSAPIDGYRFATAEPDASGDAARRFIASLSHEIRTPLNGLLGMASLLEETSLVPAQAEYVAAIRKSGARLLDLLNNVLDYARLGAGQIPLEITPFDPEDLLQDVVELIAPRAHAAGLDIAALVDESLPRKLLGDSGRLRQVLFNLAGNAVKFTEAGAVLIEARPREDGSGLSLIVRDSGLGVPHEARARLFEAFGQARVADARRDGGVGLGLAIVAQLTAAMGGEVSVLSEPGEGALFRVDLPLEAAETWQSVVTSATTAGHVRPLAALDLKPASTLALASALTSEFRIGSRDDIGRADVAVLDAALPPGRIAEAARTLPTLVVMRPEDRSRIPHFRELGCAGYLIRPLRRASVLERVRHALLGQRSAEAANEAAPTQVTGRVLIADDNPVNALLASRALTAAGFRVDCAGTGAEALECASHTPYAVIFMDIRMPVMDGLEATMRIRSTGGPSAGAPIVALTADLDPQLAERARAAGISAMATKPIDPGQLRALAERWAVRPLAAA